MASQIRTSARNFRPLCSNPAKWPHRTCGLYGTRFQVALLIPVLRRQWQPLQFFIPIQYFNGLYIHFDLTTSKASCPRVIRTTFPTNATCIGLAASLWRLEMLDCNLSLYRSIYSGSWDCTVRIWSKETLRRVSLLAFPDWVTAAKPRASNLLVHLLVCRSSAFENLQASPLLFPEVWTT